MDGIAAIQAWTRLEAAMAGFNRHLQERHGVTAIQLAMLRIIRELSPITLAELRARLVLHPATLGQLVDRLARLGLVNRITHSGDHRRRQVALTPAGERLVGAAPLAGPSRLRTYRGDPGRVEALAAAFTDAIGLFGLQEWETR